MHWVRNKAACDAPRDCEGYWLGQGFGFSAPKP